MTESVDEDFLQRLVVGAERAGILCITIPFYKSSIDEDLTEVAPEIRLMAAGISATTGYKATTMPIHLPDGTMLDREQNGVWSLDVDEAERPSVRSDPLTMPIHLPDGTMLGRKPNGVWSLVVDEVERPSVRSDPLYAVFDEANNIGGIAILILFKVPHQTLPTEELVKGLATLCCEIKDEWALEAVNLTPLTFTGGVDENYVPIRKYGDDGLFVARVCDASV